MTDNRETTLLPGATEIEPPSVRAANDASELIESASTRGPVPMGAFIAGLVTAFAVLWRMRRHRMSGNG